MRPFIIYRPNQPQRRRKARPKIVCKKCSAKRVPSDRNKAICDKCLKTEEADSRIEDASIVASDGTNRTVVPDSPDRQVIRWGDSDTEEYGFNLLKTVSIGVHKSDTEGETLDRFIKRFIPCMGIFFDAAFFMDWIVPATQGNTQIFNGALAVTTFHDLPRNDIWSFDMSERTYQRYQVALNWYRTSLKQSMDFPPDIESPQSIAMSLLTITLYLGIELRQLNWSAQEGLIQAAFSIMHSGRSKIRESRNQTILIVLGLLMDFCCMQAIRPTCIKAELWDSASTTAQYLCKGCNAGENLIVRFELYRIMYDVNIVLDRGHGSDFELECRMQRWLAQLNRFETSLPLDFKARIPALRCRFLFSQLQIAWESYLYGHDVDRKALNARLSQVLSIHEINEKNTKIIKNRPSWVLDIAIVPSCLWVAWYWRSASVLQRCRRICEAYQDYSQPEQIRFVRVVLDYITTLVSTPYDKATPLEIEMFGKKPRVLQNYQSFRVLDQLIRNNNC